MPSFGRKHSDSTQNSERSNLSVIPDASNAENKKPLFSRLPFFSRKSSRNASGSTPKMAEEVPLPKPPDPNVDPVGYLTSIHAVRERAQIVLKKAKMNELTNFHVDMSKFKNTVDYVVAIIKRDYAPDFGTIPPHGRWQHFSDKGKSRLDALLSSWSSSRVDQNERTRRLLDLTLVSVLLDAGAGSAWKYTSLETGTTFRRSEGLAIASLEMFTRGAFSSNPAQPFQVDGKGLRGLTAETMVQGFQIDKENNMEGLEGRTALMVRLGQALESKEYFGPDERPGNLLDYLLSHPKTIPSVNPNYQTIIPLPTLWTALTTSLSSIWPSTRTALSGRSLGDAWPCSSLPQSPPASEWETIAPFHKLTQWLTYSLLEPLRRVGGIKIVGEELLTGLPEYRNGGLLVDTGLLSLKPEATRRGLANYAAEHSHDGSSMEVTPVFPASDDAIVEWRAVTVGMLDEIHTAVNAALGLKGDAKLTLAQVLEAGTWKAGRELAEVCRPNLRGPPIGVISDGTVF